MESEEGLASPGKGSTRHGTAAAGAPAHPSAPRRPSTARRRGEASRSHGELGPLRVDVLEALAHEIRTPMTTIYVAAKMLAGDDRGMPAVERSEMLDAFGLEAERLYRLLEDFLAVVGAADSLGSVREPVLIQHVLRGVIDELSPGIGSRRIHAILPQGLPPVIGDADGLAHATRNIVERALDVTPEGGVVEVVVRRGRTTVGVHVYDTGRPLEPIGPDAFVPFESPEAAGQVAPGRALGLAASRTLVEAMGGRAWATRRPEGGTETGFALPLFRGDLGAARGRGRHEAQRSTLGLRNRPRRRPMRGARRERVRHGLRAGDGASSERPGRG